MSDLFLGTIAVSVLLMAIVQVATILWATRTAKRVGETIARLEQEIRPVLASLQAMAADAARVSAMAAAQADKVDQMLGVVRQRVDQTVFSLQETILTPAREVMAMLQALKEVFFGGDKRRPAYDSRRRQPADEEDALFIG
ncbi:MAG TPA: hypothetical protein VFV95_19350 [Vicinamibacterales bacterium]|nr:hypothetical protein [Vicinamibacterales bacterium]